MFGMLHTGGIVAHSGLNTASGPSHRIWNQMHGFAQGPAGDRRLILTGDDFLSFDGSVSSNVGRYSGEAGGYRSYEDTGGSILPLATEHTGVIRFLTDTTDNDENWLQTGGITGNLAKIADASGSDFLLAFEARVRFTQVTDTYNAFVGLMEEACAAADTVTDAGALADKDYIGFSVTEADGDALKFVYKKAGATAQTVLTYGTALAAATWYKVGFVYNPAAKAAERIKIYVDGAEQTTYVTATNIAASTFPDDEEMGFICGMKNGAGAAKSIDLDWWGLGQLVT